MWWVTQKTHDQSVSSKCRDKKKKKKKTKPKQKKKKHQSKIQFAREWEREITFFGIEFETNNKII